MPSNQTTNYGLSQWDATDPVLRTDFNADNAKIDTVLGSVSAAVAGKLGYSEIIYRDASNGLTNSGLILNFPKLNWDEWEYVCIQVAYQADVTDTPLTFTLQGTAAADYKNITPLRTPGYLVMLLPRHNGEKAAEGFVLSDRFHPITDGPVFKNIKQVGFSTQDSSNIISPSLIFFGGK